MNNILEFNSKYEINFAPDALADKFYELLQHICNRYNELNNKNITLRYIRTGEDDAIYISERKEYFSPKHRRYIFKNDLIKNIYQEIEYEINNRNANRIVLYDVGLECIDDDGICTTEFPNSYRIFADMYIGKDDTEREKV